MAGKRAAQGIQKRSATRSESAATNIGAVSGAGAAEIAVLWRAEDDGGTAALHAAAVGRVIGKPIAGPALRDILYPADAAKRDEGNDAVLVTHAA